MAGRVTEALCADKGYDSEALRVHIKQAGCCDSISRKQNTKSTNNHMDWHLYKIRYLVKSSFAKLKNTGRLPLDLINSSKAMKIQWL